MGLLPMVFRNGLLAWLMRKLLKLACYIGAATPVTSNSGELLSLLLPMSGGS